MALERQQTKENTNPAHPLDAGRHSRIIYTLLGITAVNGRRVWDTPKAELQPAMPAQVLEVERKILDGEITQAALDQVIYSVETKRHAHERAGSAFDHTEKVLHGLADISDSSEQIANAILASIHARQVGRAGGRIQEQPTFHQRLNIVIRALPHPRDFLEIAKKAMQPFLDDPVSEIAQNTQRIIKLLVEEIYGNRYGYYLEIERIKEIAHAKAETRDAIKEITGREIVPSEYVERLVSTARTLTFAATQSGDIEEDMIRNANALARAQQILQNPNTPVLPSDTMFIQLALAFLQHYDDTKLDAERNEADSKRALTIEAERRALYLARIALEEYKRKMKV